MATRGTESSGRPAAERRPLVVDIALKACFQALSDETDLASMGKRRRDGPWSGSGASTNATENVGASVCGVVPKAQEWTSPDGQRSDMQIAVASRRRTIGRANRGARLGSRPSGPRTRPSCRMTSRAVAAAGLTQNGFEGTGADCRRLESVLYQDNQTGIEAYRSTAGAWCRQRSDSEEWAEIVCPT